MSKNTLPRAWMAMAGLGAIGMMSHFWGHVSEDQKAFDKLVKDENITDPQKVWKICGKYHRELKNELIEAKVRIEAGEEICRIGKGLADVRKMMEGPGLPSDIKFAKAFGIEVSEEKMSAAIKDIAKNDTPIEVKKAIVAHWWTELMRLFVPWGIVLAEEIEFVEQHPCFRLVSSDVREAVLRSEVVKYKDAYEGWKKACERAHESELECVKKQAEEKGEWIEERERLLREIDELKKA